ncbi:hypothetical protein tb265_41060 [Gemmatimonadetes bacterium T265]|nr:hypothetical protein tb265_41060 [Gemmatimonadetes bacterium T265]
MTYLLPYGTRAMLALALLGGLGVAAITPVIPDLVRRAAPAGRTPPPVTPGLIALAVVQAVVVVAASAWIGARLGPSLGLESRWLATPAAAGWAPGRGGGAAPGAPLALGLILGGVGGLVAFWAAPALVAYLRALPLRTRLLYGGLTEEVVMRWGVMTGVTWLLARAIGTSAAGLRTGRVPSGVVLVAILVTNALFAAGHLPLLRATRTPAPGRAVGVIFVASLPWGWLFWRGGIESAMVAHLSFHAAVEGLARRAERATRTGPPSTG